jgi:hypothetical protein
MDGGTWAAIGSTWAAIALLGTALFVMIGKVATLLSG